MTQLALFPNLQYPHSGRAQRNTGSRYVKPVFQTSCSTLTRVEPNATLPTQTTHTAKQQSCSTLTRVEPNATIKNIQRVFRNDRACSTLTRVEPNATMTGTRAEPAVTTTCSTLTRVEPNATVPTNTIIAMPFPLAVPSLGSSPTQPWSERRSVVLSVVLQYPHSGRAQRNERIRRIAIRNISFLQYPHSAGNGNSCTCLAVPSLGSSPTQPGLKLTNSVAIKFLQYPHSGRAQRNVARRSHRALSQCVLAVPSLGSSPTQREEGARRATAIVDLAVPSLGSSPTQLA